MNKWLAMLLVAVMLFSCVGCATQPAAKEPVTDEQDTGSDIAADDPLWQIPEDTGPTLEVTLRWENREELLDFIAKISAKEAASYSASREMNGVQCTYDVSYRPTADKEKAIASLVVTESYEGESVTMTYDSVTLDLIPLSAFYSDEEGELDFYSYMYGLMMLGLYDWYEANPLAFSNAVYAIGAYVEGKGYYIVDFYLDTATVDLIEELMNNAASGETGEQVG